MVSFRWSFLSTKFILIFYFITAPVKSLILLRAVPVCRRIAVSSFIENVLLFLTATENTSPPIAWADDSNATGVDSQSSHDEETFISTAYGREEYTNSIVASRDTNISPAEAYDVIRQHIPLASDRRWGERSIRAADIGAGAGLSTAILYTEKGYHDIAAVDWSRVAWDASVVDQHSSRQSVQFYEMDDDSFFSSLPTKDNDEKLLFDIIVYNFAINKDKAAHVACTFLTKDGLLLAPCNDRKDYWYKQSYVLYDQTATARWTSDAYLDAWSIQFQPDVTSLDCTGIWCGNFNGFFEKRKQNIGMRVESLQ
jgi:hypothetical protein